MRATWIARATSVLLPVLLPVLLLLFRCPVARGQSLVDVRLYKPPRGEGPHLGEARRRIQDQIAGRSEARFPGTERTTNGPAGIPGRGSRDPTSPPAGIPGRGSRDPMSPPARPGAGVSLTRHSVSVRIVDGVAVTTIDQTFHNGLSRQMEGTYVHPLPDGAVIDGFSIFMGGREIHGVVMESGRGREIYRRIVRKSMDPGLVELLADGKPTIRTRIFPIPPRGDMRVSTRYTHLMDRERGTFLTRVPLAELTRRESKPLESLLLSVTAMGAQPLASVTASGYPFLGLEEGARRVWAGKYRATEVRPKNDLVIRSVPSLREPALTLHCHETGGERYFMAVVTSGERELTDLDLSFGRLETVDVYPERIGTLGAGRQMRVFGKFRGLRTPIGVLRCRSGGETVELRASVADPRLTGKDTGFVAGIWARNKVTELLASVGPGGPSPETRQEIVALGERFGILTPYTVFLAR